MMPMTMLKKSVLIVEAEEADRRTLRAALQGEYSVLEGCDGMQGLQLLVKNEEKIAAVLLNLDIPKLDGFTFLKRMREFSSFQNIPVIVSDQLDAGGNEIKALKLGAWDFVLKPYRDESLRFRLKNVIARSQLNAFKQLKYMAEYDTLTNIYNKETFFKETEKMLKANWHRRFAFIRFDIDRFQLINSFFGRREGDRLLKYIAGKLRGLAGSFDVCTFGRIEADVFCLCIPYAQGAEENFFAKAREQLAAYNVNYDIVPTFGIYIVTNSAMPVEFMYDCANLAAKSCKKSYINFYAFYDEKLSRDLVQEQEIINEMNLALAQEQFDIYLQPKYNLQTEQPDGAEVLVRWIHPMKGVIPPDQFIPVFERNGFIMKLDRYVWERACRLLRRWLDEGRETAPLSVNVSRVNFYNPQFCDTIIGLVEKYEIPPALLNLEVTETAYIDNPASMREVMDQLQGYGFLIMMDDFGSGYSSLNLLKDISVDILKIDMQFLSASDVSGRAENILSSVIRMAKWLSIPIVAEGVETKLQAEFLRSLGCDNAQGYYFAKPMPVYDYEKYVKAGLKPGKTEEDEVQKKKAERGAAKADAFWMQSEQINILFNSVVCAVGIYEMRDDKLELIRVNDAFFSITSEERGRFTEISADILNAVKEEERAAVKKTFIEAVGSEEPCECFYHRICRDGRLLRLHLKVKHILTVGDRHLFYGSFCDAPCQ